MMTFFNGVKVEVTKIGLKITATNGETIEFDQLGKIIYSFESQLKYFDFMGEDERNCVRNWYEIKMPSTSKEKEFFVLVGEALKFITYDYRISTIEPSIGDDGKLYYRLGESVALGLSFQEWKEKAIELAPEYNSRLAKLYELYLWYAYRLAKGYWTLDYVCNDSSSSGNYRNSPSSTGDFEKSGERKVAEAKDGVGNTYKICAMGDDIAISGGCCYCLGNEQPVADVKYRKVNDDPIFYGVGVIVLCDE